MGIKKKQVCRRWFIFSEDMCETLQNGMKNDSVNLTLLWVKCHISPEPY